MDSPLFAIFKNMLFRGDRCANKLLRSHNMMNVKYFAVEVISSSKNCKYAYIYAYCACCARKVQFRVQCHYCHRCFQIHTLQWFYVSRLAVIVLYTPTEYCQKNYK